MKIFPFIFLFFVSVSYISAEYTSPSEAIRSHREWMRVHTPSPDTLADERLMLEAMNIIDMRLQESEALRLLTAAARNIPEVETYLKWEASLECDTLMHRKRDALRGIADFLDRNHPLTLAARKARANWLDTEMLFRDVASEYDSLISKQEKICRDNKDKKEQAFLIYLKIARFNNRNNQEKVDNPQHYREIWQLERDVLKLYPINSTDTVAERMELYTQIAALKMLPQENIKVQIMLGDAPDAFDNGTLYEYIGPYRDYQCNSGFYLEKAMEMAQKLYGEFHPVTMAVAYQLTSFRLYNTTVDQEYVDIARNLNDIFSIYYPRKSAEGKHARLLKAWADFQMSENSNLQKDESSEILKIFSTYYGADSPWSINPLMQITGFNIFSGEDYTTIVNAYEQLCRSVFSNDMDFINWMVYIVSNVKLINPQDGIERMRKLKRMYLESHEGTPVSIKAGTELAYYFRNVAFNFDESLEIYKVLQADIEDMFGKHSAMAYLNRHEIFTQTATGYDEKELQYIDEIIKDANAHSFAGKQRILTKLLESKADYYWSNDKYDKAAEQYSKLSASTHGIPSVPSRLREALCRAYSGKDTKETEILIKGVRKDLDALDTLDVKAIPPQLFMELSNYYSYIDRPEEATPLMEKALEIHNYQTNYSFDDEYLEISSALAVLYDAVNNHTGASRLIASDRENLSSSRKITPTYSLVNYLLSAYYRTMARQDWTSAFFYVNKAVTSSQELLLTSGAPSHIRYLVGLPCYQAVVSMFVQIDKFVSQMQEYLAYEEFKNYAENMLQTKKQYSSYFPQIKQTLKELENGFPEFDPNYRTHPNYRMLLSTMAAFYQSCEKDYPLAESYLLKSLEVTEDPVNLKNVYFNLAGLMQISGDSVKNDLYLRKAYDLIARYPQKMEDTDILGRLSYLFSYSMKTGDSDAALSYARKIYSENRRILDGNFQLMSSAEQEQIFNTFGDPAWALASVLEKKKGEIAGETYDAVVYRTGMQLRSQQEVRRIISTSRNPDVRLIADSLRTLRAIQKQFNVSPDQWATQEGNKIFQQSSLLTFNIDHLEMQLLDLVQTERKTANPDVKWQMIRDALKPDQAAVEFLFSNEHIMALVLTPDSKQPEAVTLCRWKELSEGLDSLHAKNSASLAKRLYGDNSRLDLYSKLWQPLEKSLGTARIIFFNAPGILHSISFNAIKDNNGTYLFDKYDLRQLSTTAQITFPADEGKPQSAGLLGDVLFDPSQAAEVGIYTGNSGERAVDDDYALDDFGNRGVARRHFRYLPFTAHEIASISGIFGDAPVSRIVRDRATEQEFRTLCSSAPDVLHLATHGFFVSTEKDAMHVPFLKRYFSSIGSPMQRSGIALANAEATWKGNVELPEENDGILTANEVATLNLKATRLVALSACESALGGYNFEGIHGLTRGFKQAGVKSLLVSLWSVNDRSTATFMTAFYNHWMATGDRHAAYREAVAAVRSEYPSPFYWAPFIMLD